MRTQAYNSQIQPFVHRYNNNSKITQNQQQMQNQFINNTWVAGTPIQTQFQQLNVVNNQEPTLQTPGRPQRPNSPSTGFQPRPDFVAAREHESNIDHGEQEYPAHSGYLHYWTSVQIAMEPGNFQGNRTLDYLGPKCVKLFHKAATKQ